MNDFDTILQPPGSRTAPVTLLDYEFELVQ